MNNSGSRRDNLKFIKCALPPTQEAITLLVALVFNIGVLFKCGSRTEYVGDDRVIDN